MSRAGTSGSRYWFLQRLSAVYMVLFLLGFSLVWCGEAITYTAWETWAAHPAVNVALILFVASLLLHAWIGIRDVILDYVKPVVVRYVLLVLIALTLLSLALWALKTLLLHSMA